MPTAHRQHQPTGHGSYPAATLIPLSLSRLSRELLMEPSPVPLYFRLAQAIRKLIDDKVIQAWEKFPSEQCVADYFHVSRSTVRQAWQELEHQRLISRDHGRGTFVNGSAQLPRRSSVQGSVNRPPKELAQ